MAKTKGIPNLPLTGPTYPIVPAVGPIPPYNLLPPNVTDLLQFLVCFNAESLSGVMGTLTTNPKVGITSYGPQYVGYAAVQRMFRQLFSAFQNLQLTPQGPTTDWLSNSDGSVMGVQVNLSGQQIGSWFAKNSPYYSPPVSDIVPDGRHSIDLDACAIFYFDNNQNLIQQISIYFDRYLMQQQLTT
jgi:hypothetical protein